MNGKGDTGVSQKTGRTSQQEMGQVICSNMQICAGTPILKPSEIVLTPSKGEQKNKGGDGEPRGKPAADKTKMRRTDLALEY